MESPCASVSEWVSQSVSGQECDFFQKFFFQFFSKNFFLRLQKCMHAFGVRLDYNNTFWQIDILLDQHLDKSIIILNCIALHCIIIIKTFYWTFPPSRLWFFRLQHFPTVITKMHAYFWSLIKLCIYNIINLWTYKFIIL